MTKARFAASKAADSHQGATQPRETEAGVLTASQHMLKASEPSRGRMLLSAVVELSVRPGHQAVTASVCSARILRYLVYQLVDLIYWTIQKDIKCHNYTQFVADARSIQLWNFTHYHCIRLSVVQMNLSQNVQTVSNYSKSAVKAECIGDQSKHRWCHYSTATTSCSQHPFHNDSLKQITRLLLVWHIISESESEIL